MAGLQVHVPLPAAKALDRTLTVKEPRLLEGRLFWLEQRPWESGRTTLMMRIDGVDDPCELTPGSWNLRSRVHEYGGGIYSVAGNSLVFVDDGDRCLWRIDLPDQPRTARIPPPHQLTVPSDRGDPRAFADGFIDRGRQRWLGVMEQGGRDHLVQVPLMGGEPTILRSAGDFCGYAAVSPSGSHLAWVEWQQPFMPWERSQLWLGQFDNRGQLSCTAPIAGSSPWDPVGISVFQPLWVNGADLVVATDRSGWWNLDILSEAEALELGGNTCSALPWRPLLPMQAEFGMPQWVYGMRTTAWDGQELVAAACRDGRWELGIVSLDGAPWQLLPIPFDDLAGLDADDGALVAIAASPRQGPGLLEVDLRLGTFRHTPAAPCPLPASAISEPKPIWFSGAGGRPTHGWFTPPLGGADSESPLLVRGHSGPTAMASTGLNLVTQFWTSRGWGVVDVNYGGSTGFGRAYRERLNGQWGVVDVADCAAAALALLSEGKASPDRVAIEGSSAGGFTVLAALCFADVFRAGACRYGVGDLSALANDTHRFEARYLDTLVGQWPGERATYEARSPLHHVDRIRCPVIFFQGLDDNVVPPAQTETMALALSRANIPVEMHLYPGEGHGFRDSQVRIQVLEATEAFFRRHFEL